ncbi:MAG: hypothetical protein ABSD96_02935 [Candidatus Korobacteraceae bacterium]
MKRFAWLFLAVLCSAILVNAEDKTMSGWVCDSKCVVQNGDRATCDPTCTERSGDDVFISDDGAVSAISNPAMCASHVNKHVNATYSDQFQKNLDKAHRQTIELKELQDAGGIGG